MQTPDVSLTHLMLFQNNERNILSIGFHIVYLVDNISYTVSSLDELVIIMMLYNVIINTYVTTTYYNENAVGRSCNTGNGIFNKKN